MIKGKILLYLGFVFAGVAGGCGAIWIQDHWSNKGKGSVRAYEQNTLQLLRFLFDADGRAHWLIIPPTPLATDALIFSLRFEPSNFPRQIHKFH